MASNFAFEFTSTEKTTSGERKKSLKITFAVGAVMVSLAFAVLAAAGCINREDLPYFFGKPTTKMPQLLPPDH